MIIRTIRIDDVKDVQEVYKPFVRNTPITFEYNVPSYKKFVKRIDKTLETYPWIVAELDGKIVGYAYAAKFKDSIAFTWTAETYIYVEEMQNSQGVGTALYSALHDILELQGFFSLYAMITASAKRSIQFHEDLGYKQLYTLENCAWKFDCWYGMTCMEKKIRSFDTKPEPIIPFKFIDDKELNQIFKKYEV